MDRHPHLSVSGTIETEEGSREQDPRIKSSEHICTAGLHSTVYIILYVDVFSDQITRDKSIIIKWADRLIFFLYCLRFPGMDGL